MSAPPETEPGRTGPSRLNVPNALGIVRLIGAVIACGLAYGEMSAAFGVAVGVMLLTDFVDGRIARAWKQQTAFGAALDSVADAAMYASMTVGLWLLYPDTLVAELAWIAAAIASYVLLALVGVIRFRRVPTYHTRLAKTGWLTVGLGALLLFAGGSAWPLRIAMLAVMGTNIEAIAITLVLREHRNDVPSLRAALRMRRAATVTESPTTGG